MDSGFSKVITQEIIAAIESEFKEAITRIFEGNLLFGFIFGGIAKGYAKDFFHDVDMFVCLKSFDHEQVIEFRKFYFELHDRYGFKADPNDPGEITTLEKLKDHLQLLKTIKIRLVIESYEEYEAIVWGDMFSGRVTAQTGDLGALRAVQEECSKYPEHWRSDILAAISPEIRRLEGKMLEELNITLLFERFVTYLKRTDIPPRGRLI